MINKKYITSSVILVASIAISAVSSYSFKATADEETLSQVKQELQEQIDAKSEKLEEKDKQIEELNSKVSGQEETINQLNNNIAQLTSAINSTQEDLNTAKVQQKTDKQEVTTHTDEGDANLQSQVDEVKQNQPKQLTEEEKAQLEEQSHGQKVQNSVE